MATGESKAKRRAGRPKDSVKRTAILEAAIAMFLKRDFMDVTMDAVAYEANVSKLTVYSHFGDKDVLFAEAVRYHAMNYIPPALLDFPDDIPLRSIIVAVSTKYFDALLLQENVEGFRLLMRPRVQQAGIAQMVWRDGPQRTIQALTMLFAARVDRGEMAADAELTDAASLLLTLIRGQLFYELILGIRDSVSAEERSGHIASVVTVFCKTYDIP